MIITKTPLRISLFGGGTDFPNFYQEEEGCVLSTAIDKFIYVIIKERYDHKIRVGYSDTELVDHLDALKHELVRECLRKTGIHQRIEIATMADIPSAGSGLGSSSTVTVGLLQAMYAYLNMPQNHEALARQACEVEIDILGKPIGVQDQYIAAYGGQRFMHFSAAGVSVKSIDIQAENWATLNQNLMLFYTNITRRAETILDEQNKNIGQRIDHLRTLAQFAKEACTLLQQGNLHEIGVLLHESWRVKRELASRISNEYLDALYQTARKAGALGGKIAGAGGGGYLLLYCPSAQQPQVRQALHSLSELPFNLERNGTRIIFEQR
ncbi:MAG: GHMP kinase [Caldilineaceae bacterium]|nr:GHMP kinase [Caldilineaceae bacterium]